MYLCFMYSRRLYAKIVGGAVLIVLLSLIGSWLLITRLSFFLSFVCLLFILLITLFIIRLATRLNYKLSVFFEAMRNEDTTQHFPANPDDPFTNALYAIISSGSWVINILRLKRKAFIMRVFSE